MAETRTCEDCRYCLLEDYGYSNWTVEGTMIHCLKRLHPEREGFDRWYGDDDRLKFAQGCTGFVAGEPVQVDVEDEAYNGGERIEPWYRAYIEDAERFDLMAALERERNQPPLGDE
jgi:hypothetical protein